MLSSARSAIEYEILHTAIRQQYFLDFNIFCFVDDWCDMAVLELEHYSGMKIDHNLLNSSIFIVPSIFLCLILCSLPICLKYFLDECF